MRILKPFLAMVVLWGGSGCALDYHYRHEQGAQRRRSEYVEANPGQPERAKSLILEGRVCLGMSSEQVLASWGPPIKRNRSVSRWGVREQWIYHNVYIYIEDGCVTSWQE